MNRIIYTESKTSQNLNHLQDRFNHFGEIWKQTYMALI